MVNSQGRLLIHQKGKRKKVLLDLFSENEVMEVEKRQFGGGG